MSSFLKMFSEDLILKVKKKDRVRFHSLFSFLLFQAHSGKNITPDQLNEFLSCFENVDATKKQIKAQFLKHITERVLKRFADTEYNFPALSPTIKEVVKDVSAFFEHNRADKEKCIQVTYSLLVKHKRALIKKDQQLLTDYKLRVMAGFITICFDYKLTNKPDPNNETIFQATRNAIRKIS